MKKFLIVSFGLIAVIALAVVLLRPRLRCGRGGFAAAEQSLEPADHAAAGGCGHRDGRGDRSRHRLGRSRGRAEHVVGVLVARGDIVLFPGRAVEIRVVVRHGRSLTAGERRGEGLPSDLPPLAREVSGRGAQRHA